MSVSGRAADVGELSSRLCHCESVTFLFCGLTEEATMEEEGDTHPEMRHFPSLWSLSRSRSKSDGSGFRGLRYRVLFRLRGAHSGRTSCTVFPNNCRLQLRQPIKLNGMEKSKQINHMKLFYSFKLVNIQLRHASCLSSSI